MKSLNEEMQKAVLRGAVTSSVGKGVFHVRTKPAEQPMTILKYRLQPQYTPVPVRFRYVTIWIVVQRCVAFSHRTSYSSNSCHQKTRLWVMIIFHQIVHLCTVTVQIHLYARIFSWLLVTVAFYAAS